jgi:hypothetical protein
MRAGWLIAAALLMWGCEPATQFEGRYEGREAPISRVSLTLQAGGKGAWTVEQETTPLRWEIRDGTVWLHFKGGGVIAARPIDGAQQTLMVELPGIGTVRLLRP